MTENEVKEVQQPEVEDIEVEVTETEAQTEDQVNATNDDELEDMLRSIREFGRLKKYEPNKNLLSWVKKNKGNKNADFFKEPSPNISSILLNTSSGGSAAGSGTGGLLAVTRTTVRGGGASGLMPRAAT